MLKNKICKAIALLMLLALVFPRIDIYASETQATAKLVRGTILPSYINRHGNTYISITCTDFFEAGYEYGDVVKVKLKGQRYRMPFVSNYSDVESGKPALIARNNDEYIMLAINLGDFATTYGLATKTSAEDGSFEWNFADDSTDPIKVSIWMKKQGGYANQYALHQMSMSNERSDYPDLSDEEFANFREVKTTGMGKGRLYRTSSAINPENKRNIYVDNALKNAEVSVILNLNDTENTAKEYEGFSDSYYSTVKTKELAMDIDFSAEDFKNKLAEGLRFMADNPGIYAIQCKEGKDRAGFVVAILECLMGAGLEEVTADYMVSFYNFYGLIENDPGYELIVKGNIEKSLKTAFTFKKKDKKKELSTRDLSACAVKYLKNIGLTKAEIKKLKKNLSQNV